MLLKILTLEAVVFDVCRFIEDPIVLFISSFKRMPAECPFSQTGNESRLFQK
jgi:hypothetical protein